jgi:hypothetical protein
MDSTNGNKGVPVTVTVCGFGSPAYISWSGRLCTSQRNYL